MMLLAERFVLERVVGSGGMGRVFLGRDEVLDRPVAVKLLNPDYSETDIGARFRREGRTAAKLSHPNVVQVYDAGEAPFEGREVSYIVMEYVPGGDLKLLIDERGVLTGGEIGKLSGVAAGLAHAHERGVIHRDIKPHNILVDEYGSLKLTDFGIARALDATYATRTGSYLGTALYSAPEQLKGEKVTPKSDVYSLGATLYQAATGQPPFIGSPIEVASQHVAKDPVPPRDVNEEVGPSLDALITACLQKDPDARPPADEVRLELLEAGRGVHPTESYTEAPAAKAGAAPQPAPQPTARPAQPSGTGRAAPLPTSPAKPAGNRSGRRGGILAALAVLAVLVVAGALYAATTPGGGGDGESADGGGGGGNNTAEKPRDNGQERAASGGDGTRDTSGGNGGQGGQSRQEGAAAGQGQEVSTATEPTTTAAASASASSATEPSEERQERRGGSDGGSAEAAGGLTAQAAEQTIIDHYEVAASENYPDAWNYLSSRYQQEIGAPGVWTDQFATLESVEYTSGPIAEVDGDVAYVSYSTVATHTDRVDTPSVTATLVNENGEWKIDGIA